MRKHKISLLCAALCALMLVTAAVPALAEGAAAASGAPVAENLPQCLRGRAALRRRPGGRRADL